MKLLLDAPEHLWRLLERNKYFPAAWLFLLARVVHRALVRDDDDQEETWSRQGIDVLVLTSGFLCLYPLTQFVTGTVSSCPATMGGSIPVPFTDHT